MLIHLSSTDTGAARGRRPPAVRRRDRRPPRNIYWNVDTQRSTAIEISRGGRIFNRKFDTQRITGIDISIQYRNFDTHVRSPI